MKKNIVTKKQTNFIRLVRIFVAEEKRTSMNGLCAGIKEKLSSYTSEDAFKKEKLILFGKRMWWDFKDELYMTGDICENTIWKWQDALDTFEDDYLRVPDCPDSKPWHETLDFWKLERSIEVIKLVKEVNLDDFELTSDFIQDFMNKVRNDEQFSSILMKWYDLIQWSPWKMSIYKMAFHQPLSSHYADEINPDIDEEADYE